MPSPVLQFKRGNAGVAGTVPALRPGEPAISLNNFDFFIGIDTSVANNKFFGSHRYWERENGTNSLKLKLVSNNGSESINLQAPTGLGATFTYTLPATAIGYSGKVLTTNADGDLSWVDQVNILGVEEIVIGIGTFTNNVAFTTDTDNTLGIPTTGAVTVAGGVGIAKNLTVGAGLSVAGESYFIGTARFYGGTINLGDASGDVINIDGRIDSDLVPTTDDTYSVGISTLRWKDAHFAGVGSFASGAYVDNVTIGINSITEISTTQADLLLNSATGKVVVKQHLDVYGDIDCTGNVSVGGTTVTLRGQDVYIENKDIVLGFTTSAINYTPDDDTANHAGVAIASTEGTPLVSFSVSGINTLPDTYKQMMWFQSGTLGFQTDAFAFNYAVAVGTTQMASGVRFAVGTGITMSNDSVYASNFYGTFTGTVTGNTSSADYALVAGIATYATNAGISTQVKTVSAGDASGTYYVTFVNSHNGSATEETVYTDDAIQYDPGANLLTANNLTVTGTLIGTATTSVRAKKIDVVGVATNQNYYITLVDGSGDQKDLGVNSFLLYNGSTNALTLGTGVGVTQFSGSVSVADSTTSVPTSSAIINYVNGVDIGLAGDSGTGSVNTTQTLTINGTANEVDTSVSNQTVTIGLPNDVVVGTSLSVPTLSATYLKSINSGTLAITLQDDAASVAGNLTVGGNLYVNGSTTQVNTTTLNVKDSLVDLGLIDTGGGVLGVPTSDLNKDIGILFNWYDSSAKKAAVFWDDSLGRIVFADDVSESSSVLTVASNAYSSIEIEGLWVNDCAGQSQVITCSNSERFLQNITVDAGTF